MFEFINDMIKKKTKLTTLYFSVDFKNFIEKYKLRSNDILLKTTDKYEICYVDTTDKNGYLSVMPTAKYFNILKKYKKLNNMTNDWYIKMTNNYPLFIEKYKQQHLIDKNMQIIKSGRFINKIITDISPYEVESFTIRYKYYQNK